MDEEWLLRQDFDRLISIMSSPQSGGPEDVGAIIALGDKAIKALESMVVAGNSNAVDAIITLARRSVESFTRVAESNPVDCKKTLPHALTMPALLSPLPSVLKKYQALQETLGLGSSHPHHGKNWDYFSPISRFVIDCIDEIEMIRFCHSAFPESALGDGPSQEFAAVCGGLPELSREKNAQVAWRKALRELLRLKKSSVDADRFDFTKIPAFARNWTRARVQAKHENVVLFEEECWKDISEKLNSLAT